MTEAPEVTEAKIRAIVRMPSVLFIVVKLPLFGAKRPMMVTVETDAKSATRGGSCSKEPKINVPMMNRERSMSNCLWIARI